MLLCCVCLRIIFLAGSGVSNSGFGDSNSWSGDSKFCVVGLFCSSIYRGSVDSMFVKFVFDPMLGCV